MRYLMTLGLFLISFSAFCKKIEVKVSYDTIPTDYERSFYRPKSMEFKYRKETYTIEATDSTCEVWLIKGKKGGDLGKAEFKNVAIDSIIPSTRIPSWEISFKNARPLHVDLTGYYAGEFVIENQDSTDENDRALPLYSWSIDSDCSCDYALMDRAVTYEDYNTFFPPATIEGEMAR